MAKISSARLGFMLCAFLLPGLIGTFASFSIPAPLVDELQQEQALQAVLDAPTPEAQAKAIAALSGNEAQQAMAAQAGMSQEVPDTALVDPDTAAIVQNGTGPIEERVAAAQKNMRAEVMAQARAEAYRIRLMVITMTIIGAIFAVFVMGPDKK
jgi:ABC-type iron transport system FetAB ATPase subunit